MWQRKLDVAVIKLNMTGKNRQPKIVSTFASPHDPTLKPKFAKELQPLQPE